MTVTNKLRIPTFNRTQFARIYVIDQQLRMGKYPNVPKLAQELEVQTRTIERDIEHMRDRLGAPIAYDHYRKGYHYTSNTFRLPAVRLTEGEMVALFLGQKLLTQCAGTPLEEPVRSAFHKISALLPDSISLDFETIERAISFNVEPLRGDEEKVAGVYRELVSAIQNQTTVWMRYYSATRNDLNERKVDPYHLRYFHGVWYLIAFCHLREEVRIFALDRIEELRGTRETFVQVSGFSLPEFLGSILGIEAGDSPQEVIIKFDQHQARWISERKWHQTQKLEPQPDGFLLLTINVSGLGEVKRWVLGFGSHAEVVSPESLRQEVIAELKRTMIQYECNPRNGEKIIAPKICSRQL